MAICGASEWQQETVAFSGFEKFVDFFMNKILRLTSCRTLTGSAISSTSCLAIGSAKKTWSLRAMIFVFSLHPGRQHLRFCEETAPFKTLIDQHIQVVREQGWDAMYDY